MTGFGQIIGYEKTIEQLQNAIRGGKVSHAYIIEAPKGAGKQTLARAFAAALECEADGIDACGKCHSCKQMETGNHPDVITVHPGKTKNISVDDIREQVVADIAVRPYNGKKKIYLIPQAETLNQQSQNALLKTIEEPPEYGVILFLTENANTLLPTIRSRCVEVKLHPLSDLRIRNYLVNKRQIPANKAAICAAFAQGVLGKALLLAESEEFLQIKEEMCALFGKIGTIPSYELAAEVKRIKAYGIAPEEYLDLIRLWFRDVLLYKSTGNEEQLVFKEDVIQIRKQAASSSYEGIERVTEAIEKTRNQLKFNVNFDLSMEQLLLEIKENFK